ncbi:peptide deformylase [Beijerinckia indica]|uniref:Peptide deformylase-like n=1 Tax=Beijerinckia indica subsp. indica (strain ATCC 9039 / DSM 1715 / NCIMB 8712) TaxID=395963 RepID=B2IEY2_BEII9|nr:peptide deformylase [Beijerinckia indica]ACB94173.1 peptide deformylase [Beijerinckia indica subsp. indica ATCC 9039]
MAVRPVIRFPDPRLSMAAQKVEHFDETLRTLADDLVESLHAAHGIGITAPHIGVPARLVALELTPNQTRLYVNPEIIWSSDTKIRHQEGSVSMPGVTEIVERCAEIHVRYQDLDGSVHIEKADGFLAICHQHEIDQLDGLFWIQRLSRLKRERVIKRYEKLASDR